jgi:cyclopropane fatty-acyl-phospholipid synthase-like methyltransferase
VTDKDTLEEAEIRALETICSRAELVGGQSVLDMGCGWGSFSLFAAPL